VPGHLEVWIQLGQRLQDEPPLVESWMRDFEQRLVDRGVSVEEEVEVERSRAQRGSSGSIPAERSLELEEDTEERAGGEGRLELDDAVQEPRLVDVPDRLRVAEARDRTHLDVRNRPKPADGSAERRFTLTEVRAQPDESTCHAGSLGDRKYSPLMATRLLLAVATVLLATATPARADLVQLDWAHLQRGEQLARRAGGVEVASELRLWSVPMRGVPGLRRAGVVHLSRPDRLLRTESTEAAPSDPLVPMEWWRSAIGADRVDPPGAGKPVTVVDSGLDLTHPEFANRANTTALNPQTIGDDDEDHGTEVSSVIGAPNNGVGLVGVYPNAVLRVWDASPLGFLSESDAIRGIMAAARLGPGVINLSFGGEEDDPLLQQAVDYAFRSGSLVVAAAGNDGLDRSPPTYPAVYPHVLTIGATNSSGQVAAFSSLTPTLDLAAPGADIPVAEPLSQEASGYLLDANGTSFASPLVAGAAAWAWTVRPTLDNTQLFEVMRRSATDIGPRGFDNASGWGLLNIPAALSFPTPRRDPQEPNEQPQQIEPHALFANGTPPLTAPGRTAGSIAAHVDRAEDPVDLYRVWVPARGVLKAQATGSVSLRVLSRSAKKHALAAARQRVATYRNASAVGAYLYLEVRPHAVREASYVVRVRVARP
jgi:Subtilase family